MEEKIQSREDFLEHLKIKHGTQKNCSKNLSRGLKQKFYYLFNNRFFMNSPPHGEKNKIFNGLQND
jgi:hypothetical protein